MHNISTEPEYKILVSNETEWTKVRKENLQMEETLINDDRSYFSVCKGSLSYGNGLLKRSSLL